jgi:hypothetical protein
MQSSTERRQSWRFVSDAAGWFSCGGPSANNARDGVTRMSLGRIAGGRRHPPARCTKLGLFVRLQGLSSLVSAARKSIFARIDHQNYASKAPKLLNDLVLMRIS